MLLFSLFGFGACRFRVVYLSRERKEGWITGWGLDRMYSGILGGLVMGWEGKECGNSMSSTGYSWRLGILFLKAAFDFAIPYN
jgi:hypothetical protein